MGKGWGLGGGQESYTEGFDSRTPPMQQAFSTLNSYSKSGTLVAIVNFSTTTTIVTWVQSFL